MGKEKQSGSSTTVVNQTTTPTPTAEETALNQLQLSQAQAFDPYQRQINASAGTLINQLLTGQSNLPGFFSDIYKGVNPNLQLDASKYQITPEQANDLASQGIKDLPSYFQTQGLLDSGTAASAMARTAGDIRRNVLERNLDASLGVDQYNIDTRRAAESFNIGNLLNLLNLAVGGQAQIQQPVLSTSQMLGERLAGLRSVNTQGTTTTNSAQYGMNPFLKSFQTSMGQVPGNIFSRFGQGAGMFGGGSIR